MLVQKYNYIKIPRETSEDGTRLYTCPDGSRVSSVTTILGATGDKTFLQEWRNRIGHDKAKQITTEAANVGTLMHNTLEQYLLEGSMPPQKTNLIHKQSWKMAEQIVQNGLAYLDEAWGIEVPLYYPGLYAGTTDLVGVFKGKPAIIDFKQSNKRKKTEWVQDYFQQLGAYRLAHNQVHGTDIKCGVIMMCTRDFEYQTWVIEGEEFDHHTNLWLDRVAKFYNV